MPRPFFWDRPEPNRSRPRPSPRNYRIPTAALFKTFTGGVIMGIDTTGAAITGIAITIIGFTGIALITITTVGGAITGTGITGIAAIGAAGEKRLRCLQAPIG